MTLIYQVQLCSSAQAYLKQRMPTGMIQKYRVNLKTQSRHHNTTPGNIFELSLSSKRRQAQHRTFCRLVRT
jgi:hypothetical protein